MVAIKNIVLAATAFFAAASAAPHWPSGSDDTTGAVTGSGTSSGSGSDSGDNGYGSGENGSGGNGSGGNGSGGNGSGGNGSGGNGSGGNGSGGNGSGGNGSGGSGSGGSGGLTVTVGGTSGQCTATQTLACCSSSSGGLLGDLLDDLLGSCTVINISLLNAINVNLGSVCAQQAACCDISASGILSACVRL